MSDLSQNPRQGAFTPLLRWAGSKKRQFSKFQSLFPQRFNNYVEPFAGSAAFLFGLQPSSAILNDINSDVTDFYNHALAYRRFYSDFVSVPRNRRTYYRMRAKYNEMPRSRARSVLFYYLNRNCFNGIFRVNSAGLFNVPYSDDRVAPYLSKETFADCLQLLRRSLITNLDFDVFCRTYVKSGDFVYLDPPYYSRGSRVFNGYHLNTFGPHDFGRLDRLLQYLDRSRCRFLLSFSDAGHAHDLGKRWLVNTTSVLRTIAGDPDKREKQTEYVIMNYV